MSVARSLLPEADSPRTVTMVLQSSTATTLLVSSFAGRDLIVPAMALAVLLARFEDKETIRAEISRRFGYDLQRTVADIRPDYQFQISCQLSVPESIIAFLDSWGFEDAVRKAVSLGGDADTQAAITGGIAEAHYGLPAAMVEKVYRMLPRDIRQVVDRFNEKFKV